MKFPKISRFVRWKQVIGHQGDDNATHRNYIVVFFQRLGIALLMLVLARVIFYIFNYTAFPSVSLSPFLRGLRFDLATVVFLNIPFIILSLLPQPFRYHKLYQIVLAILFFVSNVLGLLANLVDTAYFPYVHKRSTAAMFKVAALGDDTARLLPQFLQDFWFLMLLFISLLGLMVYLYRKTTISLSNQPEKHFSWLKETLLFLLLSGLFIIAARGGFQLRPINVYNAAERNGVEMMPIVLNTPFTIIKTWDALQLEEKHYFPPSKIRGYFDMKRHYNRDKPFVQKPNVVVIVLESFSREFIGFLSGKKSYTPFLDSLMRHSWTFRYSFANGKKSVDAIPAIFASIPSLMDDAYITSAYSSNKIGSLAGILKGEGYHTSFFHGATNGSMGFDGFSQIAGFDTYFGRKEYDNEQDFDGHWGIWDEPFLLRWAQEINRIKGPFISGVMTLTSHHPFNVPERYKERFEEGSKPIHRCIQYTDYSLRRFFETAKQMPWYSNTLFVITADHTFSSDNPYYTNSIGQYAIPIVFYRPDNSLARRDSTTTIDQIDILPTILKIIGYNRAFRSFGHAANTPFNPAINYRNGVYQSIREGYLLQMINDNPSALYDISKDSLLKDNIIELLPDTARHMEQQLKGIIQTFHHVLIHNAI